MSRRIPIEDMTDGEPRVGGVPVVRRPVVNGQVACPEFRGYWLVQRDVESGEESRVPLGCRRYDCRVCGESHGRMLAVRVYCWVQDQVAQGLIDLEKDRPWMLTLTWRWRGRDGGFATSRAKARFEATGEQLREMVARDWNRLLKRFERAFGYKMPFFLRVVEITKAGAPHIHVGMINRAWSRDQKVDLEDWFRRVWLDITRDSHEVFLAPAGMVWKGPHSAPRSLTKCISYLVKYLTKFRLELGKDTHGYWENGMRHYSTAADVNLPLVKSAGCFYERDGETVINVFELKRRAGRAYSRRSRLLARDEAAFVAGNVEGRLTQAEQELVEALDKELDAVSDLRRRCRYEYNLYRRRYHHGGWWKPVERGMMAQMEDGYLREYGGMY